MSIFAAAAAPLRSDYQPVLFPPCLHPKWLQKELNLLAYCICQENSVLGTHIEMLNHIPQRKNECNNGSGLEQREEANDLARSGVSPLRPQVPPGPEHVCQNQHPSPETAAQNLIKKQVPVAQQMNRNIVFRKESTQRLFFLQRCFRFPIPF